MKTRLIGVPHFGREDEPYNDTKGKVYSVLKEHKGNFTYSKRTVARYVAKREKEIFGQRAGHLPLEHIPGEAQADSGDPEYYGKRTPYSSKYLNLSFPYSKKGYFR
jgi:hypothetical protein